MDKILRKGNPPATLREKILNAGHEDAADKNIQKRPKQIFFSFQNSTCRDIIYRPNKERCSMSWSDPKLQDLARQLAFTPAQKRREQLQAAVEFLEGIDAGEEYPWEYVLFRITGYRPRESVDHQITGRTLLADLAHLVEHVSETLEIRTDEAGDAVLSLDQVTGRFNVSSK